MPTESTHHRFCEPLEVRRLLTSVTGHSFDPDVLPQGFAYSFDTYVGESLDESDFAVGRG